MAKNKKSTKKTTRKTASKSAKTAKKAIKKEVDLTKKTKVAAAKPQAQKVVTEIPLKSTTPMTPKPGYWSFDKIASLVLAAGLIAGFAWIGFDFIPNVVMGEDEVLQAEEEAQDDSPAPTDQAVLDEEAENLSFVDQSVDFKTNFGDLQINLLDKIAPKNVENIVRLASRDYYDGLEFHRIVEQDNFKVIQGGDPSGDGTGGQSAFGTDIEDEIYTVAPEFAEVDGETTLANTPEFTSELYKDLDEATGQITYQKGLMIMANRGPDTNSSQFFITLADTTLQPRYTIVGQVQATSFGVLDEISAEIDPVDGSGEIVEDGRPNKELRIDDVVIN